MSFSEEFHEQADTVQNVHHPMPIHLNDLIRNSVFWIYNQFKQDNASNIDIATLWVLSRYHWI